MVTEEHNFTKAAERLYITQPAISKVIHSLEQDLGTKLFIRHPNKRIELTEAGQLYREMFRKLAAEFARVQTLVNNMSRTNHMKMRLAYASRWSVAEFLPDALAAVHAEYPNLAVELECLEFRQIVDDLLQNRLDIVLSFSDYFEQEKEITYAPVTRINQVIVYSDLYVSEHGTVSTPVDFEDATFFLSDSERERGTPDKIYGLFAPYGYVPRLQYLRNWDSVVAKVEAGLGVVIFDTWVQYLRMKQFHGVDLNSSHSVALAWRKGLPSDIVQCVLGHIRTFATLGKCYLTGQ